MKFPLAAWVWIMGCGIFWGQTPTSTHWHLPLDAAAGEVRRASDSAGVLVPSIQPLTAWNRPAALQPTGNAFEGGGVSIVVHVDETRQSRRSQNTQ